MISAAVKRIKQFLKEFRRRKIFWAIGILFIIFLALVVFKTLNNSQIEKISLNPNKDEGSQWNTSNEETIETHTVYMILSEADNDSEVNIAGNKIKINCTEPDINITPLNITNNRVVSADENGNIMIPEKGLKLRITGVQDGNSYDFGIQRIETIYTYSRTFENLIIEINAETENEISAYIKEITKIVDGEEVTVEGSAEKTALLLYEDENGTVKIKGNSDLEIYYVTSDIYGLTNEQLESAEWEAYDKENGVSLATNGKIYSKTKYKNGEYSQIQVIDITNIDKLKPQIETTNIALGIVSNEVHLNLVLSDREATVEYGKSGVYGYALTTDELEPTTFIAVDENIDQTVYIDGIANNGTYYAWVRDVAGNVESTSFVIDFITEREDELILVLDAPVAELKGERYASFSRLNTALEENGITKDSGNVLVQLVDHIPNETMKVKNKNITIDLNGYSITSKMLEPTIDVVNGSLEVIDKKLNIADYIEEGELRDGLIAKFSANNDDGKIISTKFIGIQVEEQGSLTLGTDESISAVPATTPVIQGDLKGVVNVGGRFNYYDGEIIAKNVTIEGNITDKPALYDTVNGLASDGIMLSAKLRMVSGVEAIIGRNRYTKLEKAIEEANTIYGTSDDKIEIDIVSEITKNETIIIQPENNIVLDLNGNILTSTANGYLLENFGKLEIINSGDDQSVGKVLKTYNPAIHNAANAEFVLSSGTIETTNNFAILNNGKANINGGKINTKGTTVDPCAIMNETTGELEFNGGEIIAQNSKPGTANARNNYFAYGIYNKGNLETTVGNINSSITKTNEFTFAYGIYNEGEAEVSGLTIKGQYGSFNKENATITLTGNTFNDVEYGIYNEGEMTTNSNTVNASLYGIYNKQVLNSDSDNIAAENSLTSIITYGIYNEETGTINLKNSTISKANNSVSNNGYFKAEDINIESGTYGLTNLSNGTMEVIRGIITVVTYGFDNNGQLNADGTKITTNSYAVNNKGIAQLQNMNMSGKRAGLNNLGQLTSTNDSISSNNIGANNAGTLTLLGSNISVNTKTLGSEENQIYVYGIQNTKGTLTVESGNITVTSTTEEYIYKYGINNGVLGTIILGKDDEDISISDPSISASTYGVCNLGEFYYYDGEIISTNGLYGRINATPEGYNISVGSEGEQEKITLREENNSINNPDSVDVAYVGNDENNLYNSLQEAITACGDENTITLVKDLTLTGSETNLISSNQNITINLNGKNIKTYSVGNIFTNEGELTIQNSESTGGIEGFASSIIYNNGTALIKDIKIETDLYAVYNVQNGIATVNNCNLNGNQYSIYNEGNVTVENNSIITNDIYNKETGTLNVNNSSIIIENTDKNKFYDAVLNSYGDIVSYGIYNESGIVNVDTSNITITQSDTGFNVYGIYNLDGLIGIENTNIQISIASSSRGYGIFTNSEQESIVIDTDITVQDTDKTSKMYGIYIEGESSKLTINNGNILSQGTIADSKTKSYSDKSYGIYNEGNITVNSGNIEVSNVYETTYGIWNTATGNITISGGQILINQTGTTSTKALCYGIDNSGEIVIQNNTNIEVQGSCATYGINNKNSGVITIEKGKITLSKNRSSRYDTNGISNSGKATILDAEINATIYNLGDAYGIQNSRTGILVLGENTATDPSNTTPYIKGMTYGVHNSGEMSFYDGIIYGKEGNSIYGAVQDCAGGFNITKYGYGETTDYEINEGEEITVLERTNVAHLQSNDRNYLYIEEAFADAISEDKITLISNIVIKNTINIPNNKNITFDLNGYTITNAVSGYILENQGILTIMDSNPTEGKTQIISNSYSAINNKENATLILNEITFLSIFNAEDRKVINNKGNLNINNSNISLRSSKSDSYGVYNDETGKVTIVGGNIESELTAKGDAKKTFITYGVYNNGGEVEIETTKIDVLTAQTTIELYGIYNNLGKLQATNIDLNVNTVTNITSYGIYNNSAEKTILHGGSISLNDEKNYTRMYGIYNTSISEIDISNVNIEVNSLGYEESTSWNLIHFYGIYNEGKINSNQNKISVNNLYSNAYGIFNEMQGIVISEEDEIEIEHSGNARYSAYSLYNMGTMSIDKGTMTSDDKYKSYGIYNEITGEIVVNDTTITATRENQTTRYDAYGICNDGNITVTDSIIKGNTDFGNGYGIYNSVTGNVVIGEKDETISLIMPEIEGTSYGIGNIGNIYFYDGIIKGRNAIYGSIEEIANNSDVIINKNGDKEEAILGKATEVAYIGNNESILYDDIQEAIDTITSTDTITLVKDVILTTEQVKNIPANKNITLNLNGHKLIGYSSGTIIINEGILTIIDDLNDEGEIIANAQKAILNKEYGTVNVNSKITAIQYAVYNEGYGTINIDHEIESQNCAVKNEGTGTINIGNVDVKGAENAIHNSGTGRIKLNNTNVISSSLGIYNEGEGSIEVNSGNISIIDNKPLNYEKVIYGVYNNIGTMTLTETKIEMTSWVSSLSAYAIENISGKVTITNIDIDMNFTQGGAKIYGIHNNSNKNAIIQSGHIKLNEEASGSKLYGIFTESNGTTIVEGTNLEVTAPYIYYSSGKAYGSTSYGIYNKGQTTINTLTINVSSNAIDAYGFYNDGAGILTVNDSDITVRHENPERKNTSSYHAYGMVNNTTDGATINGNTVLRVYDNFTPYGINNTAYGNLVINNIELIVSQTGTSTTMSAYGINNTGAVTLAGGNITVNTKGTGYGIYNNNHAIIGKDDSIYDGTTPNISGKSYGVYQGKGTLYYYDGTISGDTYAIYGYVDKVTAGYKINYLNSMTIAQLVPEGDIASTIVVNGQYFESLDVAIRVISATESKVGVVEINSDLLDLDTPITIEEGVNITLVLQGNKITFDNLETAITNNGILSIIEFENPEKITQDTSKIINSNGTLIQNNGTLIIGQEERTEISLELEGNPAISGDDAIIYGATIDGEFIVTEQPSGGSSNPIKPFYLTMTENDANIVLSTDPILNKRTTNWENKDITVDIEADVIPVLKLYSTRITHYSIEYYYEDISGEYPEYKIDNSRTEKFEILIDDVVNFEDIESNILNNEITGFLCVNIENCPVEAKADESKNIIKIYYDRKIYDYKIEYYYESILTSEYEIDDTKTENGTAKFEAVISTCTDNTIIGYELDEDRTTLPFTIQDDAENAEINTIKIYYKRKIYNYKVNYYYESIETSQYEIDNEKEETFSAKYKAQIAENDIPNKVILGYELDRDTSTLPFTIDDDAENAEINTINVYYKRKIYLCKVEYYYESIETSEYKIDNSKTVNSYIKFMTIISSYEDKAIEGYELDTESTTVLPITINDDAENAEINTIKIYYKRKIYNYKVNYYYESIETSQYEIDNEKEETFSAKYKTQIGENDIPNKVKIGYELDRDTSTLPFIICDDAENASINTIKVFYKRKIYTFRVKYYYESIDTSEYKIDNDRTETYTAKFRTVIDSYVDKNIVGYELDTEKTTVMPIIIKDDAQDANVNLIKIYYKRKIYNYRVNYYYESIENSQYELDNDKTDNYTEKFGTVISSYIDKCIIGYELDTKKTTSLPISIQDDAENASINTINVYYKRRIYNYRIEYYYECVSSSDYEIYNSKTENRTAKYKAKIEQSDVPDKIMTGFEFVAEKTTALPFIIEDDAENAEINVIKVYYNRKIYNYRIEYYYESILTSEYEIDNEKTDPFTAKFGTTILTYEDKVIIGYELDEELSTEFPFTIKDDAENTEINTIKIYYKRRIYDCKIEYYYESIVTSEYEIDEEKTDPFTAKFGAIIPTYEDKVIIGYELDVEKTTVLPFTINDDAENTEINVIRVYYKRKPYNYRIEYYYESILTSEYEINAEKTDNFTDKFGTVLLTYEDKVIIGYELDEDNSTAFPFTIKDDAENTEINTIKIFYKRKIYDCRIEYYYESILTSEYEINEEKTENYTAKFGVIVSDYEDKCITGYELNTQKTTALPITISDDAENEKINIIRVYYKRKIYNCKVEYYYESILTSEYEIDDSKTENDGIKFGTVIPERKDKCIIGYELDEELSTEFPFTIMDDAENTEINLIKIYYKRKIYNCKIEYYYESILTSGYEIDDEKTNEFTAKYGVIVSNYEDKCITGYELDTQRTTALPITINDDTENEKINIIRIYYKRKIYNCRVEYYYESIFTSQYEMDASKTENDGIKFGTVIPERKDKCITGYELDEDLSTEFPFTIKDDADNAEINLIRIYYKRKIYNCRIEYYYESIATSEYEIDEEKTIAFTAKFGVIVSNYADKCIIGYELDTQKTIALPITISDDVEDNQINIIKIYYKRKIYNCKVEYYYESILTSEYEIDDSKTEIDEIKFGTVIPERKDKCITGYELDEELSTEFPFTINDDAENERINLIRIYYKRKYYNFRIEYHYENIETSEFEINASKTDNFTEKFGVIISNYEDKCITGYELDEELSTLLPITISDDAENPEINIIRIFYKRKFYNCKIEYYYESILTSEYEIDDSKTEIDEIKFGTVIPERKDKCITGYELDEELSTEFPITISEDAENERINLIKIYYKRKIYNCKIEYYYENIETSVYEMDASKTDSYTAKFGVIVSSYEDKCITGYELAKERTTALPITINDDAENEKINIIRVYYKRKFYNCRVEYYYESILTSQYEIDASKTEKASIKFGEIINRIEDKCITGYELDTQKSTVLPIVISDNAENEEINIIRIYYKRKFYNYKIEYYYENINTSEYEIDASKTDIYTEKFGVTVSNYENKCITGYELDEESSTEFPFTIKDDAENDQINIIKIYYKRKFYNCREEYYYENIETSRYEIDNSKTIPARIKFGEIIDRIDDKCITGYELDTQKSTLLPITISDDAENDQINIIKIYYKRKLYDYRIEYYYENLDISEYEIDSSKTENKTAKFGVVVSNYEDKCLKGFELNEALSTQLPITISDDAENEQINIIKIYYKRKTYNFKVEYYYENILTSEYKIDTSKTETDSIKYGTIIESCVDKCITGYEIDTERSTQLPITINDNEDNTETNVIRIFYKRKLYNYKIEYYYESIEDISEYKIDSSKTENKTAKFGVIVSNYADKCITGYELDEDFSTLLPITISDDAENPDINVIKIFYKRKLYDCEEVYYYESILTSEYEIDNSKTIFARIKFGEPISKFDDKCITGYEIDTERTTQLPITIRDDAENPEINIIRIYYKRKLYNCKIEYYYENKDTSEYEIDNTKTQTAKIKFGEEIAEYDNYCITGYELDENNSTAFPFTVSDDAENPDINVIKIFYKRKLYDCKEVYYYESILTSEYEIDNDKTISARIKFGEPISKFDDKCITGYEIDTERTTQLPITIRDDAENPDINVIRVFYKRKIYDYRIEYYYESIDTLEYEIDALKTENGTAKYKEQIIAENVPNKIKMGYELNEEMTTIIPFMINDDTENAEINVIKIYYNRRLYNQRIEYYYESILNSKYVLDTDKIEYLQNKVGTVISSYEDKCITGYELDEENTTELPITISDDIEDEDTNVIRVYYKRKLYNCRLEYYYESVLTSEYEIDNSKTIPASIKFGTEISKFDDECISGYELDTVRSTAFPFTVSDDTNNPEVNIARIYYKRKTYGYRIEYYYENILTSEYEIDSSKTEEGPAQYGHIITSFTDKNILGYELDEEKTTSVPFTVTEDNDIIKVYYKRGTFGYTIEYYYNDIKKDDATIFDTALYHTQFTLEDVPNKNITGYKVDETKTGPIPFIVSEIDANNVMKIYYILNSEDKKELKYTVEYYKDGTIVEEDTEVITKVVHILQPDVLEVNKTNINTVDKYVGCKFDKIEPEEIPDVIDNNGVIKVYYVRETFRFTVEYYYEDELDAGKTEYMEALYEEEITPDKILDKNIFGYKLDGGKTGRLVITEDPVNNIFRVYYVIDDDNVKELKYTIEYYKDGKIVEEDKKEITKRVQILQPDTIKVDTELINTVDKYKGYKLNKTIPDTIPDEVTNGDTIKIYYVLDTDQIKELYYTLEYYKDEEIVEEDTITHKEEVHILHSNKIEVYKEEINTTNKYKGYEFVSITPNEIPDEVETGTTIKVYYKQKMKTLSYRVEYYKEGKIVEEDSKTTSITVPELYESDRIKVDKSQIDLDKYFGYKVDKTVPSTIPNAIENGNTIKIYYEIDQDKTKDLTYTIEYFIESRLVEKDTYEYKETVQVLQPDIIPINVATLIPSNKYYGYKLNLTQPGNLSNGVQTGTEIKAYYVLDPDQTKTIEYTVEYYKDGELVKKDIEKYTQKVHVLDGDSVKVDKSKINIINKYSGYLLEKTNPAQIQDYAEDGDIIKVYYIKDQMAKTLMQTGEDEPIGLFIGISVCLTFAGVSFIAYRKIKNN